MKIIGHRGAKGLAEENTKASFIAGLNNSVDAIELDIRTSKDAKLVVHHDPNIGELNIATTDYVELKKAMTELLTLQEALNIINDACPVIIEIKKGSDITILTTVLKKTKLPKDVNFASFNMPILRAIKMSFPDASLTVNEKWSGVRGSYRCKALHTKYISMNQRWLWSGFIASMSRGGYKLGAYPLNNPKKAKKWTKYGLYAAITDFPNLY
jgi:glycerophosphoryl diester phosphodiesterase